MHSCVDAHVCSHVDAIFQVHHDLLDALLQKFPCCSKVVLVGGRWHRDRHSCGCGRVLKPVDRGAVKSLVCGGERVGDMKDGRK